MNADAAALRAEMNAGFRELRAEMNADAAALRAEIKAEVVEILTSNQTNMRWMIALFITSTISLMGFIKFLS